MVLLAMALCAACDLGPTDDGPATARSSGAQPQIAPATSAPGEPPAVGSAEKTTASSGQSSTTAAGLAPAIVSQDGRDTISLPAPLVQTIMTVYPGFRVPGQPDLASAWSGMARPGALPFITWGDYTGDGLTDVAAILLSDAGWKLVAFHQTREGGYDAVVIVESEAGRRAAGAAEAPKDRWLATLRRGEKYAASSVGAAGMELRREIKFGVDAIEVEIKEGSRTFYFWDGKKYESYEFGYE